MVVVYPMDCIFSSLAHQPIDVTDANAFAKPEGMAYFIPNEGPLNPGMKTHSETVYVTYIVASPEKVWEALTLPVFSQEYFFGRRVKSDWKVGSQVTYYLSDGRVDVQGKVLQSEPPNLLSFTWHVEWHEEFRRLPETIVRFNIDSLGGFVRLTMTEQHPVTMDEKYLDGGRRGWPVILSGLKTLLETGHPLPAFDLAVWT
ncbi:Activator of Hsp90 ATPase 1 family protein (modular protein) [Verrucomicrobia bacterium]|nr:Activator of Hsp90 ATPase 1 family protein (modular protein) [Verrucomicrobiota bacterium]